MVVEEGLGVREVERSLGITFGAALRFSPLAL
ncbi:hypothetical protein [Desulfuromonas thiophila]